MLKCLRLFQGPRKKGERRAREGAASARGVFSSWVAGHPRPIPRPRGHISRHREGALESVVCFRESGESYVNDEPGPAARARRARRIASSRLRRQSRARCRTKACARARRASTAWLVCVPQAWPAGIRSRPCCRPVRPSEALARSHSLPSRAARLSGRARGSQTPRPCKRRRGCIR